MHDYLVLRQFHADRPNQLWLTDITEHRTDAGKFYPCAIKDVHSKRIVGYSMDHRMTSALAVSAVRNALRLRGPVETILHPCRMSQFRFKVFVQTLKTNGLTGSMGRVAAWGDNAVMESFFALLQKNVLDRQRWATRKDLRLALVAWIERTHHRKRRQRALAKLTPIEFEILGQATTEAARNQQHPTEN